MGNRSLLEFSHDNCPRTREGALSLGLALAEYMRSGSAASLPAGVKLRHARHHTELCPVDALRLVGGGIKNGEAVALARSTLRMPE